MKMRRNAPQPMWSSIHTRSTNPPTVAKSTATSPFGYAKWGGPKSHFPTRPQPAKLPPMPHHSPGEARPRSHSPSAPRSRAARAALVYLGRRNGTRVWVSPWGQCVGLEGFLWVTRCHLCHPVGRKPLRHPGVDRDPVRTSERRRLAAALFSGLGPGLRRGDGWGWGFGADGWHSDREVEPPPQTPPRRVGALVPLPRSGFIGNQPPH